MANNRARYEEALSRGHAYSWDQRWHDAIREFQIAVEEIPTAPAPYAGLGMAFYELNDLSRALENYKQAARYSRGDMIYLRQVADVQERLGQLSAAGQTYMAIGEIHLRNQQLDEAIDNWQRAVRVEPGLLGAHQRLAAVYRRRGIVRNAIREYLAIARILQSQGENNKALQTCQIALELDPRNADVLTAIELIQRGEMAFADDEEPGHQADGSGIGQAVQRIATAFEKDVADWQTTQPPSESASPVQDAQRMALEQLAEEIFEEEEPPTAVPGATIEEPGLSKLERDALISQALDFQTRNMVNEAISCYERAIAGGVTSTAAHFNLGLLYQDKLRFEQAIREFEIAVEEPEYRLASHFALGECFRARGRIEKAIEHFITVLKIVDLATVRHDQADRLIELYENLADSLLTQGEPERATAFANALVEFLSHKGWADKVKEARSRLDALSGERTMILADVLTAGSEQVLESLFLSQEYARRGMYSTAVEEAYRAIQLSPDYLPAHIQLAELLAQQGLQRAASTKFAAIGDIYRARGDVGGAINAYERVVEIASLDVSSRARLIDMLKRHGRIDQALEHYRAMGDAYYQLAQIDKARETYAEALKLAPRGDGEKNWPVTLLRLIGDLDLQRLDWRRAVSTYRELRRLDPDAERPAITLIDLYYKVGQPLDALRELDQYLIQLVKTGRGAKVPGILQDMVNQRPTDPGLVRRLARLYLQQRRQREAITLLDRLAEHQLDNGQTEQAIGTIEQIVKLNPPNVASYRQIISQLRSELS